MRIAYCISGFARVYKDTAPLLKKNVFDVLRSSNHEVDVFISTWKLTDRGGYEEWIERPYFELEKYYEPLVSYFVEDNWEYENRYVCDFYKRHNAFEQIADYLETKDVEPYDIVFRDRFETVHFSTFEVSELDRCMEKQKILIPRYQNDHGKRPLQDWTAFGPYRCMKAYFDVFKLIEDVSYEENLNKLNSPNVHPKDPEWVLCAGLKEQDQEWDWSSYEVTPYDRYFGNKVHEVNVYKEGDQKFYLRTRRYGNTKIPEGAIEKKFD